MTPMRLLVTGAAGMLGHDLARRRRARRPRRRSPSTAPDLDITDAGRRRRAVRDARPDAVVNCAAWTDVDGAEAARGPPRPRQRRRRGQRRRGRRRRRRARRPRLDRLRLRRHGERAVHRVEPDRAAIGAYGRSKLAGEHAVADGRAADARDRAHRPGCSARTARTSSPRCCALGAERDELTVVDDQVGCPTYTGHLAPALVEIAERAPRRACSTSPARGSLLVVRPRRRDVRRRRRRRARVRRGTHGRPRPPRAAPRLLRAAHRARRRAASCPPGRTACAAYLAASRCAA